MTLTGLGLAITTASAATYAVASADHTILADASLNVVSVTLPAAPATGRLLLIKKIDNTNNVVIDGNGKTIDGQASVTLGVQYAFRRIQYNGTAWFVIGQ